MPSQELLLYDGMRQWGWSRNYCRRRGIQLLRIWNRQRGCGWPNSLLGTLAAAFKHCMHIYVAHHRSLSTNKNNEKSVEAVYCDLLQLLKNDWFSFHMTTREKTSVIWKKTAPVQNPHMHWRKKFTSSATYATSETPSSSIVAPCHVNTYKAPHSKNDPFPYWEDSACAHWHMWNTFLPSKIEVQFIFDHDNVHWYVRYTFCS